MLECNSNVKYMRYSHIFKKETVMWNSRYLCIRVD